MFLCVVIYISCNMSVMFFTNLLAVRVLQAVVYHQNVWKIMMLAVSIFSDWT